MMKSCKNLVSMGAAFAFIFALSGCAASSSEPVSLPSKITHYSTQGDRVDESTLTYDENGNLKTLVQVTTTGPGTYYSFDTGTASSYDQSKTVDNYEISLDSDGYATGVTYWQTSKNGDVSPSMAPMSVEHNNKGEITAIDLGSTEKGVGILPSKTLITYRSDGTIEKIVEEGDNSTSVDDFNEEGWKVSGSFSGSYTGNVSSTRELIKDANGKVTTIEYKNIKGGTDTLTVEYDDENRVSALLLNGSKYVEVEYVSIETPSPSAKAFSQLKISSSSGLPWIPFMK